MENALLVFKEYNGAKTRRALRTELESDLAELGLSAEDVWMSQHLTDGALCMSAQVDRKFLTALLDIGNQWKFRFFFTFRISSCVFVSQLESRCRAHHEPVSRFFASS